MWLRAVGRKNRSGSGETVAIYRFHLAKLRWYCERVAGVTPPRWTLQDVERFKDYLDDIPADALCFRDEKRYAVQGEESYTPFSRQPSPPSSRSDIARLFHVLFKNWHNMGYVRLNPMEREGAGSRRKVNARRSGVIEASTVSHIALEMQSMVSHLHGPHAARIVHICTGGSPPAITWDSICHTS